MWWNQGRLGSLEVFGVRKGRVRSSTSNDHELARRLDLISQALHEQWWRAVEESGSPIVVVDPREGTVLGANGALRDLVLWDSIPGKGLKIWDLILQEDQERLGRLMEGCLGGQEGVLDRVCLVSSSRGTVPCHVRARWVIFSGLEAVELTFRPIGTERFGITDKAATFFKDLIRIAPFLHDFDQVLDRIVEIFAQAVPFQAFALGLVEEGELERVTLYTGPDPLEEFLSQVQEHLLAALLHLGVTIHPTKLKHSVRERGWIPSQRDSRIRSQLILPIPISGALRVHGFGGLFHQEPEAFRSEDLGLFSAFVGGIASSYLVYHSFRRVEKQSYTDPLTGLVNRRGLSQQVEPLLAMVKRERRPISLVMVDIDHFKSINDRWGHKVGDEALRQLARALRQGVREMDLVARLGGEEFLIVLPGIDGRSAGEIAERLRGEVASMSLEMPPETAQKAPDSGIRLTISLGVGEVRSWEDLDSAINRVDRALYKAKEEGRNRMAMA